MGQMVGCVICHRAVPIEQTDIVGQGYRCTPCSQRAVVDQHSGKQRNADHLSASERAYLHRSGTNMIVFGVLGLVVGAAIAIVALGVGAKIAGASIALTSAGGMSLGFARRKAGRIDR
jgi:hypothetical protein